MGGNKERVSNFVNNQTILPCHMSILGSFYTHHISPLLLSCQHRCNNTNATFVIELTTDPDVLASSLLPALPYSDPIAILYNLLGVDSYVFPETVSRLFFTPSHPCTLPLPPLTSTSLTSLRFHNSYQQIKLWVLSSRLSMDIPFSP